MEINHINLTIELILGSGRIEESNAGLYALG